MACAAELSPTTWDSSLLAVAFASAVTAFTLLLAFVKLSFIVVVALLTILFSIALFTAIPAASFTDADNCIRRRGDFQGLVYLSHLRLRRR